MLLASMLSAYLRCARLFSADSMARKNFYEGRNEDGDDDEKNEGGKCVVEGEKMEGEDDNEDEGVDSDDKKMISALLTDSMRIYGRRLCIANTRVEREGRVRGSATGTRKKVMVMRSLTEEIKTINEEEKLFYDKMEKIVEKEMEIEEKKAGKSIENEEKETKQEKGIEKAIEKEKNEIDKDEVGEIENFRWEDFFSSEDLQYFHATSAADLIKDLMRKF